jgi:hypothetical protein
MYISKKRVSSIVGDSKTAKGCKGHRRMIELAGVGYIWLNDSG